jgi:hypothetical protein
MPIDRHRRDALASILVQILRGELPFHESWTQTHAVLEKERRVGEHGFPVLMAEQVEIERVDDRVLDLLVGQSIHFHLPALWSKKISTREKHWNALNRTLALVRSNLDEPDLARPNIHLVTAHSRIIMIIVTLIALVIALTAVCLEHPIGATIWPIVGVTMLWKMKVFIRRTSRETPEASPFLTTAQLQAATMLIGSDEIPAFDPNRFPRPVRPKTHWTFYLLLPIGIVAAILFGAVMITIIILAWPLIVSDHLRKVSSPPSLRLFN